MLGKRNLWAIATVILIACGEQGINGDYLDIPQENSSGTSSSKIAPGPIYLYAPPNNEIGAISPNLVEASALTYCQDFDENETRLHQGKRKKQICDKRDGTKYVWVTIGKQDWLAENLNIAKDKNGKSIGRCYKDNNENCKTYGRLYTLAEAICPEGWHIPSGMELAIMLKYADPNYEEGSELTGEGKNNSAISLKSTSGWSGRESNPNGTDQYGFSALPGGYCGGGCPDNNATITGTTLGTFTYLGEKSYWWTTSVGSPAPLSVTWTINSSNTVNDAMQSYPHSRFYARCIRD